MKYRRYITIIKIVSINLFFLSINMSLASEQKIINLIDYYNENSEYYNAITESMRYQYLYPDGEYYSMSMLLMGEAYYKGGNYYSATNTLALCYERFKNRSEGEKALKNLGQIRLIEGSPYFAFQTFQEYQYIYGKGEYREEVSVNICYAMALMNDFEGAESSIDDYFQKYPNGNYLTSVKELQVQIDNEINRPRKNRWISLIGSIFIPGFGHFYTGKYDVGFFSLLTNAALMYMVYDGYRDGDNFRMILFGLAELSFYQHSLYFSQINVSEYNSSNNFYKSVSMSIRKPF